LISFYEGGKITAGTVYFQLLNVISFNLKFNKNRTLIYADIGDIPELVANRWQIKGGVTGSECRIPGNNHRGSCRCETTKQVPEMKPELDSFFMIANF
ncbi:MAG: hypothetical protein Q8904_11140, partial [Bacteroidota bacterium]|nr:hypothetical protein [Bacteroidota bacterium]